MNTNYNIAYERFMKSGETLVNEGVKIVTKILKENGVLSYDECEDLLDIYIRIDNDTCEVLCSLSLDENDEVVVQTMTHFGFMMKHLDAYDVSNIVASLENAGLV